MNENALTLMFFVGIFTTWWFLHIGDVLRYSVNCWTRFDTIILIAIVAWFLFWCGPPLTYLWITGVFG